MKLLPKPPSKNFYRHLFSLALPLILQNILTQSLALIDTFMVGSLGENQLAAVTFANTPFFIIMLLLFGLQAGSSVLISQYWGKRDIESINRILGIGLYIAGGVTIFCCGFVYFFTDAVMGLVTSNQELIPMCSSYGRIVAFAFVINSFSMMYIAAQRSIGNSRFGMYVLGVSMVTNTFLNWVFIFGNLGAPALGIEGAALATVLSRIIELVITMFLAFRLTNLPLIFKRILRPGILMLKDFVRYATPVVANEALWGIGFSLYPVIIGHMDDSVSAMAAFTIAGNIERVTSSINFGLGAATAVIIGNAIGAGKSHEQVYQQGHILNRLSVIIGLLAGIGLILLTIFLIRPYLFPLFKLTAQAQEYCWIMMIILAVLSPIRAFNFTNIVGVLRGGGDVRMSLILDVGFMYILALPLAAYFGLALSYSVIWIYVAMALDEVCKSVGSGIRFKNKHWVHDVTR